MRGSYFVAALVCGAIAIQPVCANARNAPEARGASLSAARPGPSIALPSDTIRRLKSGNEGNIKSALDDVRVAGRAGAPAVPTIVELLNAGLSLPLTKAALETLGDTGSDAASETIGFYTRHRNVELRRLAVSALAKTRGSTTVKALRWALADSDPTVRGLAATELGTLKAKEAVADLFAALEHNVPEAAAAIGELCADSDCERLAGKVGSLPFDVVTSGLDEVLLRAAPDVKDELKIKIVGNVRELGTGQANRFLKGVQTRWPQRASLRVKQAIDQAVLATSSSPGADPSDGKRAPASIPGGVR